MLRMTRFPGARTTKTYAALGVVVRASVLAGVLAPAAAHASELRPADPGHRHVLLGSSA